jgi:type IV secretion system protein VirB4
MWGDLAMTGILAVAAGALTQPAARKLFLGEVEYDWLAGELDLDCIEPDNCTVSLKSGTMFRVFKLRGASYDAKVQAGQDAMHKVRSSLIHALGELGCELRFYGIKRSRDISFDAEWPSPALQEIGDAEREQFQASFFIDWYVLISSDSMMPLVEASGKIFAMAGDYLPERVERPVDQSEPCPLTGFMNFLVCGELRDDLSAVSENISGSLPGSDLCFQQTGIIETYTPTRKLHQIIAIRAWPEVLSGHILTDIMSLPGDLEISQLCVPWDHEKALLLYKRKANEQRKGFIGNQTLANECDATTQLLSEGSTTLFHTQLQIIVRAAAKPQLADTVTRICDILGRRRITHSVETKGAAICWFNRLPTAVKGVMGASGMLRPLTLRNDNIAALWAFSHAPTGMTKSPFGDRPTRFFQTPSGQAYAFQFHVSDRPQSIGNFLVFAPSGGGKSTLLMHLLGGLAKFDGVRSYVFDSKEGARFMVEAMGGIYQGYNDLQLNPLDVGEDTPRNRHRIDSLLRAMAADATPSEDDDQIFAHAVELAFKLDTPERTLNQLFEFSFAKRTPLRRAFARWVTDSKGKVGRHAHVFNAPHDSLAGFLTSTHLVGINMNEALDDPVLGPPVVAHISEAISKSAANNSRGFCIFIDEAAKLLQNDGFKSLAMEMYREYRKLNGSVGLAFQDPAALHRSGAAEAFLENTATLIFLPNSQASVASLEPFNLNEEQISFIIGGTGKVGARQALIVKRDAAAGLDESAIIDVDLTPYGDALRFYRAGVDANHHLENLKSQWGEQWQDHL